MTEYNRRQIIQAGLGASVALPSLFAAPHAGGAPSPTPGLRLEANAPISSHSALLTMGTVRCPDGRTITADGRSLLWDGRPWLPVMGEFHYSRIPESEWLGELRKVKAGGIDLVSTYVFWIHHEEVEGKWDWTGRRSLRDFTEVCRAAGLLLLVRCGPWCHGEVRNGGFPDWLLHKGYTLRSDDPGYLAEAKRLYAQIADQLRGHLWKDGGAVVGIQCENEYSGPAQHLLTLKRMAQQAGLDVPLYTRTGWPGLSTPMPPGEMLPLFGSYAEGFWDRKLTPMPDPYGDAFRFLLARGATTAAIGTDQLGAHTEQTGDETGDAPYCCCEIGGGMASSYHRRIRIAARDIESASLVKIGSGNNLQGYYMYHGGTNPDGRLSTLQESQATGYWNDLPVKTYDFHAPLGEFGQLNPHYHSLRRLHLFLRDWGTDLATMPAFVPQDTPKTSQDTTTLRWAARTDGTQGCVFVNNYQRLQPMSAHHAVQFDLGLTKGRLRFPVTPVTVPADSVFFWPFGWDLDGAALVYATAQPICQVTHEGTTYIVFGQTPHIPSEFVFQNPVTLEHANGEPETAGNHLHIRNVRPGFGEALRLKTPQGTVAIILLDDVHSLQCWKGTLAGQERLFLSGASLSFEDTALTLSADDPAHLSVAIFPAPKSLMDGGNSLAPRPEGIFHRYQINTPKSIPITAQAETIQAAGPARKITLGSQGVAEAPEDADFAQAAIWHIRFSATPDSHRDLRLRIRYVGDVARLSLGDRLLDDNFYDGEAFEFGLKEFGPALYTDGLRLQILPLRRDAPIYLTTDPRPGFGSAESVARLESVEIMERHTIQLKTE